VRKVSRQEVEGVEQEVEVLNPSMYFAVEKKDGGSCSVNNVYLNGVRVASVLPDGEARYYHTDRSTAGLSPQPLEKWCSGCI